ncbi:hypothetical protein LQD23_08260 [Chromobacterium violaceum]|uniref:hypothetical protein n=1 Tax=Chromobacterium violaceum TaxID=536 RepID=UPI001E646D9F|nr:hypothetical protein [Chromobacterium violaceum]MCD0492288.1 hypothetical protein [Chromobacterium violaceum]
MSDESLGRIIAVAKMRNEKPFAISPSAITAYGIELHTRHGNVFEMIQMLSFAEECAKLDVAPSVKSAFYDSNSCTCNFELNGSPDFETKDLILLCALKEIVQFEWDGTIHHGRGCECECCQERDDDDE